MSAPVRTSRADHNYLGLGANGAVDFFAGTPDARPGVLPDPFVVIPDHPQDWDAVIKAGGGVGNGWTIKGGQAAQGRENVLDCNHVHDNYFDIDYGVGGGQGDNVITIKGGSFNITCAGSIYSRGRNADYVQDAWSDQSSQLCSGIDLSGLARADGQPVAIILGRFGSKIDSYPASYKVLFWKSLGYKIYWVGKWAAVKLGLIKGIK